MAGLEANVWKPLSAVPVAHHDKFVAQAYSKSGTNAKPETIQIGQINGLTEPSGWSAGEPVSRLGYIEYHPPSDHKVKLYTYDRGHRLSAEAAKSFKDVLYNYGPHTLKADELAELQKNGVLRDKSPGTGFVPLIAKTEDVNNRRVLVLEGTFNNGDLHARTMYIDADVKRDGSVVQELTFQAPGVVYYQYLPEARKAIQSIAWR